MELNFKFDSTTSKKNKLLYILSTLNLTPVGPFGKDRIKTDLLEKLSIIPKIIFHYFGRSDNSRKLNKDLNFDLLGTEENISLNYAPVDITCAEPLSEI